MIVLREEIPIGPVVVIGHPLHEVKHRTWHTADGSVPAVTYPHVKVTGVKVLKILVKGNKVLWTRHSVRYSVGNGILLCKGSHRLRDFSHLISLLHSTLCNMDLINLDTTPSLKYVDCSMITSTYSWVWHTQRHVDQCVISCCIGWPVDVDRSSSHILRMLVLRS